MADEGLTTNDVPVKAKPLLLFPITTNDVPVKAKPLLLLATDNDRCACEGQTAATSHEETKTYERVRSRNPN